MKLSIKAIIGSTLLTLCVVNALLFAKTVILTDEITRLEKQMVTITVENKQLERKVYSIQSLDKLSQRAEALGFVKKAEPLYLDTLRFAKAESKIVHE